MPDNLTPLKIHARLLPYYLFYTIIILLTLNAPFFWDKDLIVSKKATWFFENNFNLNLPNSFDTGYFPALSLLLASLWKIFGKSLITGHLLMLPFALSLIYQFYRTLTCFSGKSRFIHFTMILLLIDTTLLSQIVVVSTDLLMMFFFFLSLNAVLYKKRNMLYISIAGLSMSHARGVTACMVIFLTEVVLNFMSADNKKQVIRNSIALLPQYIPAALIFILYQAYHYYQTGWIISHKNSPWIGCFEPVDFKGFIFNIGILIWRLIDYGRLFIWIGLLTGLVWLFKLKVKIDNKTRQLLIILILVSLFFFPSMLFYKVLSAHRYLLPLFSVLTILTGYLLYVRINLKRSGNIIFAVMVTGLITGNTWIYPDKIAKGWDSTIAHLPYHSLRKKMVSYIESRQIRFSDVGSDVPNTAEQKYIYANEDERFFPLKDLKRDKYVFYSNILNMFTDEELDELKNSWILEKEYRCIQVKVQLYRNPNEALIIRQSSP